MKKMKFLLGVLGCFLLTLSFGVNKVHAEKTSNPSEYFSKLDAIIEGEQNGVDVLNGMNQGEDGQGTNPTSCITVPAGFCFGDVVHLKGTIVDGVTVTYNGQEYTGSIDWEFPIEGDVVVEFTARQGSGTEYDFSVTLSENEKCYFCESDPSKDSQIKECVEAGEKSEADCVQEYCPTVLCELDPSKDPEIEECITGGKTEEECIKDICTFCKEDPSKDKEVKKCIDEGGKETDCIQKICVKENPKTGITSPMIGIIGLITLVVANVLIFRKREN